MKKAGIAITLITLVFGINFSYAKSVSNDLCNTGSLIVEPNAGLPQKDLDRVIGEHKGNAVRIGQSNMFIVDLPGKSEKSVAARLKHNPHFKFAEPDCLVETDFIPNDPNYLSSWHLPKIRAHEAWDTAQGAGVTIAILDSGVYAGHPDLAGRVVPGWNFYNDNSVTTDVYGHGTKVAGSAAATANNAIGGSGVAGQARIMPIRVTNTSGSGYLSLIAQGIVHAADHGARVANASFAALPASAAVRNASQYMKDKGGLVTVSAGNYGTDAGYAATSTMIAVSATDTNDMKASWSSFGNYVSVAAPGVSIFTTTSGGGYGYVSGTSFASPVTAGVIALMMSANPNLSSTDIERLLFSTAVDLGDMGRDKYFGYGRINADAAVEAARGATPALDFQLPTVEITSPDPDTVVAGLVPVSVLATDNMAISHVELWANNTRVAVDSSQPFAFTWDSVGVSNGQIVLIARAYDAAGNVAMSDPVTVTVSNGIIAVQKDTTAPVIQIARPVAGSVSGNVTITAEATDNGPVSGITQSIYIDGVLKTVGTGGVVSMNWNTKPKHVSGGYHVIKVVAKDAAGNSSTASVVVNVVK